MITTNEYNTQKISLGSLQNKKSREGIEYQNIPILYDGKRAIVHLCGRFNLEENVSFDSSPNYSNSLGVEVDDDNRKLFEDFEKKLQSLTGDCELKLIKYGRVYLKIYVNDKGLKFMLMIRAKWHQNSGRFFVKMEKSTRKQFGTKNLYLVKILKVK